MPILLESIDKIARQKQRNVLFIRFDSDFIEDINYKAWPFRQKLIEWLNKENIPFYPCADLATDHDFNIDESFNHDYLGQLYLDVPYDVDDPIYQKLAHHLETPEGHYKIEGVLFYLLQLETALKNAHHDDPDFKVFAKNDKEIY